MDPPKNSPPLLVELLKWVAICLVIVGVISFLIGTVGIEDANIGPVFMRLFYFVGCAVPIWICAEVIKLLTEIRDQLAIANKGESCTKILESVNTLADEARERKRLKKQESIEQAAKING